MNSSQRALQEQLEFAQFASLQAEKLVLNSYQDPQLKAERKKDGSLVTRVDLECEKLLRELIRKAFPNDSILGEETGLTKGSTNYTWVIDPIDGTYSFLRGVPLFGIMIGLLYHEQPVVGFVTMPALEEKYYASQGFGAWWTSPRHKQALKATVSLENYINKAHLCSAPIQSFEKANRLDVFLRFNKSTADSRGWCDCYSHLLVATGRMDIAVDPLAAIWDCAALVPIVTEAGGKFFNMQGTSQIDKTGAVSTNSRLSTEVVALLTQN